MKFADCNTLDMRRSNRSKTKPSCRLRLSHWTASKSLASLRSCHKGRLSKRVPAVSWGTPQRSCQCGIGNAMTHGKPHKLHAPTPGGVCVLVKHYKSQHSQGLIKGHGRSYTDVIWTALVPVVRGFAGRGEL